MEMTDILQQTWRIDCLGCAIATASVVPPGGMIAEKRSCYVHQDPEVPLVGFLVLGTKRHVQSLAELTEKEYCDMTALLFESRKALRLFPDIQSITLVQEERSAHFHLWLFPWYQWMLEHDETNSLSHIRPIMAALKQHPPCSHDLQQILAGVEKLRTEMGKGGKSEHIESNL